jgi:hypothetical protein
MLKTRSSSRGGVLIVASLNAKTTTTEARTLAKRIRPQ